MSKKHNFTDNFDPATSKYINKDKFLLTGKTINIPVGFFRVTEYMDFFCELTYDPAIESIRGYEGDIIFISKETIYDNEDDEFHYIISISGLNLIGRNTCCKCLKISLDTDIDELDDIAYFFNENLEKIDVPDRIVNKTIEFLDSDSIYDDSRVSFQYLIENYKNTILIEAFNNEDTNKSEKYTVSYNWNSGVSMIMYDAAVSGDSIFICVYDNNYRVIKYIDKYIYFISKIESEDNIAYELPIASYIFLLTTFRDILKMDGEYIIFQPTTHKSQETIEKMILKFIDDKITNKGGSYDKM